MAGDLRAGLRAEVQLLRNMINVAPSTRSWEPMPLSTIANDGTVIVAGDELPATARSNNSEGFTSARDCVRRRAAYICLDSTDDLEDPELAAEEPEVRRKDRWKEEDPDEGKDIELPLEPLPESIYGFAIASLIQDSLQIHAHGAMGSLRPLRICSAFLLCMLTFTIQCLLIVETKKLVTPTDVKHVREVYGKYEHTMYQDDKGVNHTYVTENGYDRGIAGYFNEGNFDKLSSANKELVCRVPLSQPVFCFMVLFVWTLTVLSHMRDILNTSLRIYFVKTISHQDLHELIDDKFQHHSESAQGATSHVAVQGLTSWMKAAIISLVQIPRMLMTCVLLWLGCRWLIATVGFGDLLLNCVALEFILNLAALLYNVLVPYSGKILVQSTHLPHLHRHEHENCGNMFGMFSCGIFATLLVWIYMYRLQLVLPHYQWDVRKSCTNFLNKELGGD